MQTPTTDRPLSSPPCITASTRLLVASAVAADVERVSIAASWHHATSDAVVIADLTAVEVAEVARIVVARHARAGATVASGNSCSLVSVDGRSVALPSRIASARADCSVFKLVPRADETVPAPCSFWCSLEAAPHLVRTAADLATLHQLPLHLATDAAAPIVDRATAHIARARELLDLAPVAYPGLEWIARWLERHPLRSTPLCVGLGEPSPLALCSGSGTTLYRSTHGLVLACPAEDIGAWAASSWRAIPHRGEAIMTALLDAYRAAGGVRVTNRDCLYWAVVALLTNACHAISRTCSAVRDGGGLPDLMAATDVPSIEKLAFDLVDVMSIGAAHV